MILELKILTKNMKVYMHTCAKFQEHSERDVEDTSLSFSVFVCVFSYINGLILEILKNKYTWNTQEDDNKREI